MGKKRNFWTPVEREERIEGIGGVNRRRKLRGKECCYISPPAGATLIHWLIHVTYNSNKLNNFIPSFSVRERERERKKHETEKQGYQTFKNE